MKTMRIGANAHALLAMTALCCLVASSAFAQPEEPPPEELPAEAVEGEAEPEATEAVFVLPQPSPLFAPGEPSVPFQEVPGQLPTLSSQSCNACHGTVHDEWSGSGHAQAWQSELYQEALAAAEEPVYCLRCHVPLLNQRREVVRGYNEELLSRPTTDPNPRFEPTLEAEGVGCAACHVRDGHVWGHRTLPPGQAPHVSIRHPEYSGADFCASCHQLTWPGTEEKPLYNTHGEWLASAWSEAGVLCQDCHMPLTLGVVGGTRTAAHPSHQIVGKSDDKMLSRAVTVLVGPTPPVLQRGTELNVQVRVLNTGAGHYFPTGNPHAWIELRVRCEGVEGLEPAQVSWPMRRVVNLEPDHEEGEDTRLPPGGELLADYSFTPGKKLTTPSTLELVVELVYHRLPAELAEQYGKESQDVSRVFHSQVVKIPLR